MHAELGWTEPLANKCRERESGQVHELPKSLCLPIPPNILHVSFSYVARCEEAGHPGSYSSLNESVFTQDPAVEQAFDQRNSLGSDGLVVGWK